MLYKICSFISHETTLSIYKTMIRPYMVYGEFVVDSAHVTKVDKLERLQERLVRLIEYCPVKENWKDINVLLHEYNIEPLKTQRKRNIVNLMYDQSKENVNIRVNHCNIKLRNANKIILKSQFTRLTKVKKSPCYKFKGEIKKYNFNC